MVGMTEKSTKPNHISLIYMYKKDLALNKEEGLIYHKTNPSMFNIYVQIKVGIK